MQLASFRALALPLFAASAFAQLPAIELDPQVTQQFHGSSIRSFRPIASFNVAGGVAEIVDVSRTGGFLVYTDAGAEEVGIVDIRNPNRPRQAGVLAMGGEPVSVSILGDYAYVAVWVDRPVTGQLPPAQNPGRLVVIDLRNPGTATIAGSIDIGYHPDSCKARLVNGQVQVVVAIENQPIVVGSNGLVTSADVPGNLADVSPAGLVQVVRVDHANLANSVVTSVAIPAADLAAAGCLFPNDPQPEFVAWQGRYCVVTLQENNGVAVIDMLNPNQPQLVRVFSKGVCAPRAADLRRDAKIDFSQLFPTNAGAVVDGAGQPVPAGVRMSDAIAFSRDGSVIYTCDEGEMSFTGGRGISWSTIDGTFLGDDAGELEEAAVVFGHYPDSRSAAKGIEMEGATTATFGGNDFLFALSERGSFMAVYDINIPTQPRFVQLLPTGISPEGVVAIPQRGLVATSEEVSGTITIFQGVEGVWRGDRQQPTLFSSDFTTPWGALSGLTNGSLPGQFVAVNDNALPSAIYTIQTGRGTAPVTKIKPVLKASVQALYDFEGICNDTSIVTTGVGGYWCASEGNGTTQPNLLVQVDAAGNAVREIQLPNSIDAGANAAIGGVARGPVGGMRIRSNGYEGCSLSTDGRYAFAAIQRDFNNEFPTGPIYVRIARYDLQQLQDPTTPSSGIRFGGNWDFFYYQLDTTDLVNWAGLSEITTIGDNRFLVIERDKGIGAGSTLKKIYAFDLSNVTPDADGIPDAADTVAKILVRDCVAEFTPYEKIEGVVIERGNLWVQLDNDLGAHESRLRNLGRLGRVFPR